MMAPADRGGPIPFLGDDGRRSIAAAGRSPAKVAVFRSKRMKARRQNPPHGPLSPSSDEFASRQAGSSSPLDVTPPSGDDALITPEFAPAAFPSALSFGGSAAATVEPGTAAAVADAAPGGGARNVATTGGTPVEHDRGASGSLCFAPPPAAAPSPREERATAETPPLIRGKKPLITQRTSSRAAARLALQRICRGSSFVDAGDPAHPVAVSSESSSQTDDIFPEDSHDVSSPGVQGHSTAGTIAEGGASETGRHKSSLPVTSVASKISVPGEEVREPVLSSSVESHGPDGVQTTVEQMTLPPSSSNLAVDPVALHTPSHTDSVLVATDVLASCEATAAGLWCEVDGQVSFDIPVAAPLLSTFPSDAPVKQNLSHLQSMVVRDPTLTYSALKAMAEKMTELLILMGSPLEDWCRCVTLLLKLVKRREFLANELPGRLAVMETRRSECELALRPLQGEVDHLRNVFNSAQTEVATMESAVAELKLELAAAEAKLQQLSASQAQRVEAISSVEKKVVATTLELMELGAQKESLEVMSAFPFAGILPLEKIFKDL